jgi:hypothetical protein
VQVPDNSTTIRRPRAPKGPFDDLKQFIGVCAKARKQLDPETLVENGKRAVGEFLGGMDEDSKALVSDVVGMFRRPR